MNLEFSSLVNLQFKTSVNKCNFDRSALADAVEVEAAEDRGEDLVGVCQQRGGTPEAVAQHHLVHRRGKGEADQSRNLNQQKGSPGENLGKIPGKNSV